MILGFKKQFVPKILDGTKIHTIREDKHNRWKAGQLINFATGVRTKDYKEFKKGKCVSVQKIYIDSESCTISVDGRWLKKDEMEKLTFNDGFVTWEHLFMWFRDGFSGKIIHWTAYKY